MRHINTLREMGVYYVPENATEEELEYFENEVERKLERLSRTDISFTGNDVFRAEIILQNALDTILEMRRTNYWERRKARQ